MSEQTRAKGRGTKMFRLDPIERASLALSAGAVGAAYLFGSATFANGMAVGAALEAVNLRMQVKAARVFFSGERPEKMGAGPWVGGFTSRFGFLGIAVIGALYYGADPAGLLVGFSLAMPAVVVWAWRNRPAVLDFEVESGLAPDDPSWDRWSLWAAKDVEPSDDEDDEDRKDREEGMRLI